MNLVKAEIGEFPEDKSKKDQTDPATHKEEYKGLFLGVIKIFYRFLFIHHIEIKTILFERSIGPGCLTIIQDPLLWSGKRLNIEPMGFDR